MIMELKDIKEIRRKFNLTQAQLAKKSGVSQSLIAKIEAERLDPTYSNAKKIFKALDDLTKEQDTKAEEIMIKSIVSVAPDSEVTEVIRKMRKYEISQVVVVETGKLVGYVSEKDVLDAYTEGKKTAKTKEIMRDSPPTVTKDASMTMISEILKSYPLVIVVEKGKILGIITKSDILRKAYKTGLF
jgi:predicted transcriptional regulator